MREAFSQYLGRNKPAWHSRFAYTAAETIAMLHQAGGIAVFAHPGQLDPGMKVQPQIIRELVECRLDGLEIFYPGHTRNMQKHLKDLAKKYNLLATGGSDFHGSNRAGNLAGTPGNICPPDSIMEEIHNRLPGGMLP
jgi:predicted metal-dependent phosphoesterase TrpH